MKNGQHTYARQRENPLGGGGCQVQMQPLYAAPEKEPQRHFTDDDAHSQKYENRSEHDGSVSAFPQSKTSENWIKRILPSVADPHAYLLSSSSIFFSRIGDMVTVSGTGMVCAPTFSWIFSFPGKVSNVRLRSNNNWRGALGGNVTV